MHRACSYTPLSEDVWVPQTKMSPCASPSGYKAARLPQYTLSSEAQNWLPPLGTTAQHCTYPVFRRCSDQIVLFLAGNSSPLTPLSLVHSIGLSLVSTNSGVFLSRIWLLPSQKAEARSPAHHPHALAFPGRYCLADSPACCSHLLHRTLDLDTQIAASCLECTCTALLLSDISNSCSKADLVRVCCLRQIISGYIQ